MSSWILPLLSGCVSKEEAPEPIDHSSLAERLQSEDETTQNQAWVDLHQDISTDAVYRNDEDLKRVLQEKVPVETNSYRQVILFGALSRYDKREAILAIGDFCDTHDYKKTPNELATTQAQNALGTLCNSAYLDQDLSPQQKDVCCKSAAFFMHQICEF